MKNKLTRVIILTSCISPNTKIGDITNFTLEKRAKELINNIKIIYKSKLFKKIIVVDSSPLNSFPKNYSLKIYLKSLGASTNQKIEFITFKPSKCLIKQISLRGAGLSEMQMLLYILKRINIKSNTIIFKLSGRYIIKNLLFVIKDLDKKFSSDVIFCMPKSEMFSKTSSIFYAFNKKFPLEIFDEICKKVADGEGLYVEHLFYSEIFLNSFVKSKRMKVLPIYPYKLEGGHNQGKYTRIKQFLNNFILKYL